MEYAWSAWVLHLVVVFGAPLFRVPKGQSALAFGAKYTGEPLFMGHLLKVTTDRLPSFKKLTHVI
jgi:hypothetical protein